MNAREWWHGFNGVPRPKVAPVFRYPECQAWSPSMTPSNLRHECSRRDGHTGRHAAYGTREVLAVWL